MQEPRGLDIHKKDQLDDPSRPIDKIEPTVETKNTRQIPKPPLPCMCFM